MDVRLRAAVSDGRRAELEAWLAGQTTTERLFRAVDAAGLRITEIVHQDEYTLDLVVPLPDGLTLVYDTT